MSISDEPVRHDETILIVDDNEDTAEYIATLLDDAGYVTIVVDCGVKALAIIKDKPVDLALLDVLMPDMNGMAVARKVKALSGTDFLPVILVTALCTDADKVEGLQYADDYLTKPFSADELLARINSLLRIRRLHKELLLSKERYQCLYENFPHLYISINSSRNITNCNRFFREKYSMTNEAVIGKSFFSLFREQDHEMVESFLQSFTEDNTSLVGQRIFTAVSQENGENIQLSLKAVYTGLEDDGLNIVIAMEDITEQVRLQEEQKIARQQLYRSARLASIGTLASGVAHEINNPLTAILGFSSALTSRIEQREPLDEEELAEYLGIINKEALRCRDIVENLSKFAREADIETVRVNLRQCVDDALKLTHSRANRANITIVNKVDSGILIRSDANKLEQVFINIIANCIDFCNRGSVVVVENKPVNENDKYCTITIVDDGPGIAADILQKVFDPFFTTKEVGQGTGLGLAIVHKIIEESNGHIDIISNEGSGTTVLLDMLVCR